MPTDPSPPRAALVLLAAGAGTRVGQDLNKVFLPLAGRRVFTWSLQWADAVPSVVRRVLVVADRDRDLAQAVLAREAPHMEVELVTGGASRHGSEWHALQALAAEIEAGDIDVVVIHDAARPICSSAVFAEVIELAHRFGGAVPVRPQAMLVTAERGAAAPPDVVSVQTPQGFRATDLLHAYRKAADVGFEGTDTASCVERFGDLEVRCVDGSATNIKITFPEDLLLAEHLLAAAHWDLSRLPGGDDVH